MEEKERLTIPTMFAESVRRHTDANALSFVEEEPLSYNQLQDRIGTVIAYLEKLGIRQGDRVAILSTNMPNWGISYLAVVFMGAVVVPLLPDFSPTEIENILEHSGSKALFVSEGLRHKIQNAGDRGPEHVIRIEDFAANTTLPHGVKYDSGEKPERAYRVQEEDLAAIIYTSGTTGSSKGVMLSHRNICSNVIACRLLHPVKKGDRFLSILPLSHTFENTIGFMVPLMNGATVYYLKKLPTPSVLLSAMQKVQPSIMLAVPMVIEKIYFQKIMPALYGRKTMRIMMRVHFLKRMMIKAAGRKLIRSFGGKLEFFGIGGAKLNTRVEQFLLDAGIPYAIGYGLTEASPLLAGAVVGKTRLGSTGPAIEGVEIKIYEPNKTTGEGEIWARGPNVMKGYYREPGLTAEAITPDGWLRTGDLGTFDQDGNLYIKGRLKNTILGSSGENIYPEEIEFMINGFRHVVESLVIEQKGKLVALVHINLEELETAYHHLREEVSNFMEAKIEEILLEIKAYVNARVSKFSQLHAVVLQTVPFQKTATQKIKRFLYR